MKLYFSPGACSLSPHIVLCEAGLVFETEKVNLSKKITAGGKDYKTINPKGSVPALQLDDGQILTEGPAIVQYIADLVPEKQLAPVAGSMARYRLMESLNFISSELHKGFSPLFNSEVPELSKQMARDALAVRFDIVAHQLESAEYLLGGQFTVADAYLFTILNWTGMLQFDMHRWPVIATYQARVAARPGVRAAMLAEGLIKG
ncbi:MAG: glutathione transferase GstA [Glaciimonas sp.]|nr:glutathione transferase GstA [Glaciimonas sp.]